MVDYLGFTVTEKALIDDFDARNTIYIQILSPHPGWDMSE